MCQAENHYKTVCKYCTEIQNISSKTGKIHRYKRDSTAKKIPAINEIIQLWIRCQNRRNFIKELEQAAELVSRGQPILKAVFTRLTEFVAMENLIMGPVRAGAVTRLKLKIIKTARPQWWHKDKAIDQ